MDGGRLPGGRHIAPSGPDNHNRWLQIAGVVGDVKYTGLDSAPEPAFYRLYTEFPDRDTVKLNLVVRSSIAATLPHKIERETRAIGLKRDSERRGNTRYG